MKMEEIYKGLIRANAVLKAANSAHSCDEITDKELHEVLDCVEDMLKTIQDDMEKVLE